MDRNTLFRELHKGPEMLVMPNPWDPGSAKLLEHCGFKALATTSAGFAWSRGLQDGEVGFEAMIAHCRELAAAVTVPVSGDLEKGKGDSADSAGETIFAADAAGLSGCSIEDHTGDPQHPIFDFSLAVERVAAAAEAARALKHDFVFTARAENFLWNRPDLDDTIRRLQAFEEAGADVLYAPGISSIEQIRQICASVSKPVNVLASSPNFTVASLADAGVRRISLGSRLSSAALSALNGAAKEILVHGTFSFTGDVLSSAVISEAMRRRRA